MKKTLIFVMCVSSLNYSFAEEYEFKYPKKEFIYNKKNGDEYLIVKGKANFSGGLNYNIGVQFFCLKKHDCISASGIIDQDLNLDVNLSFYNIKKWDINYVYIENKGECANENWRFNLKTKTAEAILYKRNEERNNENCSYLEDEKMYYIEII